MDWFDYFYLLLAFFAMLPVTSAMVNRANSLTFRIETKELDLAQSGTKRFVSYRFSSYPIMFRFHII